jgi:hypothetical protein
MKRSNKRRVTLSLSLEQFTELTLLMEEDGQDNFTFYAVYLINQEKKRRAEAVEAPKKAVGRPKKEKEDDEDPTLYPAPYDGGGTYTRAELESYYAFHNKPMPPLPKPVKK